MAEERELLEVRVEDAERFGSTRSNQPLTRGAQPRTTTSTATPVLTTETKALDLQVDNLAQAKDRAQLTATGAMSVVHVALLKEVLDKGPDGMQFFYPSLVLICISLFMQILAGIMALLVSHLRSYFAKYRDDLIEDMYENFFCCSRVVKRNASPWRKKIKRLIDIDPHDLDEDDDKELENKDEDTVTVVERRSCCCCLCTGTRSLSNYEYDMLDLYDEWKGQHTMIELLSAKCDVQVPYLKNQLKEAEQDLEKVKSHKEEYAPTDFEKKVKEHRKEIDEIKEKLDMFEDAQRKLAMSSAQGEILLARSDSVRRNRVLKLASFWQQMINYIFYFVFILNAFITGLGIAGKDPADQ